MKTKLFLALLTLTLGVRGQTMKQITGQFIRSAENVPPKDDHTGTGVHSNPGGTVFKTTLKVENKIYTLYKCSFEDINGKPGTVQQQQLRPKTACYIESERLDSGKVLTIQGEMRETEIYSAKILTAKTQTQEKEGSLIQQEPSQFQYQSQIKGECQIQGQSITSVEQARKNAEFAQLDALKAKDGIGFYKEMNGNGTGSARCNKKK
jgi:hypothetical protein